jgi:hypothetical protein
VQVRTDAQEVVVLAGDQVVARHPRCWAAHQTLTDPEHAAAAAAMRAAFADRRTGSTLRSAEVDVEVEQRDLVVYDRVFTVIEGGAGTGTPAP